VHPSLDLVCSFLSVVWHGYIKCFIDAAMDLLAVLLLLLLLLLL
jgi:hypothetical protein